MRDQELTDRARNERSTSSSATPAFDAASRVPAAAADESPPLPASEFARLLRELSEPDGKYFSDNFVSNETSYLQVAPLLTKRARKGGAYIGVGPEQNFTYIGLIEPALAFVVDIRRQNALEHLLYKAIFDEASSRAHFLALLLGRPYAPEHDAGPQASIEALLSALEKSAPDIATFKAVQARVLERIAGSYGIALSKQDRLALERTQRAFFDRQLELKFELHGDNTRRYPPLAELLVVRDPTGAALGFLANEQLFRRVQRLEKKNRVVPVVGDFAGKHALRAIAAELVRRKLAVSVFYVSNVEQYILDPPKWKHWLDNVDALPAHEQSLFLRCYLDQGRRHPDQMPGHRSASVLQSFDYFKARYRKVGVRFTGFWQLATEGVLSDD